MNVKKLKKNIGGDRQRNKNKIQEILINQKNYLNAIFINYTGAVGNDDPTYVRKN